MEPESDAAGRVADNAAIVRRDDELVEGRRFYRQALEDAARVVECWSLPTIQTPSMWLIDKAGIAAEIRRLGDE